MWRLLMLIEMKLAGHLGRCTSLVVSAITSPPAIFFLNVFFCAGHLGRCISLVVSAITSPPAIHAGGVAQAAGDDTYVSGRQSLGGRLSARKHLLQQLDLLLPVPSRTVSTSGLACPAAQALRQDLYSAILKLLQYLKRQGGGGGREEVEAGAGDVEAVVVRHRVELFRVAVLDVCGAPVEKATPAQRRVECECKATALAVIQVCICMCTHTHTHTHTLLFALIFLCLL
jgi:hypothetical protein